MTEQRLVVITGAARGIGLTVARDAISRGYRVVIADLDEVAAAHAAASIGDAASSVRLDVTDRDGLRATIAQIESIHGPIAVWINNAGIMPTGRFDQQDADVARRIIEINYAALVDATNVILPIMLARGSGHILNLASATGIKPLAGVAVYSGTKAAVIAFSDALRRELRGTGVRVSVVMPNLTLTPLAAGITPPPLTGAVAPQAVSDAVMRLLANGRFSAVVPRALGPVLRLSKLLPIAAQDWIDDRIGTDSIGLGGNPASRAAYLAEVALAEVAPVTQAESPLPT